MYEENSFGESTARKWFNHFTQGHFGLSNCHNFERQSSFDEDCLNVLIHNNSHQSTRKFTNVTASD